MTNVGLRSLVTPLPPLSPRIRRACDWQILPPAIERPVPGDATVVLLSGGDRHVVQSARNERRRVAIRRRAVAEHAVLIAPPTVCSTVLLQAARVLHRGADRPPAAAQHLRDEGGRRWSGTITQLAKHVGAPAIRVAGTREGAAVLELPRDRGEGQRGRDRRWIPVRTIGGRARTVAPAVRESGAGQRAAVATAGTDRGEGAVGDPEGERVA